MTMWRKSSYSGQNGDCVEIAEVADRVAIRNSNRPDAVTLALPRQAVAAFVAASKDGEYDDLA